MIKLCSPDIRSPDIKKVVAVLANGNLVQGEKVASFEKELQKFTALPYSVVMSSGTAALHLALLSLELPKKCGVIVPAFTFPATANVVENIGGHTILCDVDLENYVVTPEIIEQTILNNKKKNIKAIIIVHEFGQPVRIKEIAQIAQKYKLKLIEDAACALGTYADGYHVGHFSEMACFSFHPRKAITTGEGGVVLTRSKILGNKLKILRNHGIDPGHNKDFTMAGLNYRLTDFQAVLGREQLKRFKKELQTRKKLIKIYFDNLKNQDKIKLPFLEHDHSWQSFMVVLDERINRQKLIKRLLKKGIQTNYGAQALNCLSYYQKKYHYQAEDFPVATRLYERGLVLPLYGKLKPTIIQKISKIFKEEIKNT